MAEAGGPRARLTAARKWLVGIALAALTVVLTDLATGAIRDSWDALFGESVSPLTVTADVTRSRRTAFVFAEPLAALTPPPEDLGSSPDARLRWAADNQGVDADVTVVEVIVEGTGEAPVILRSLTVDVVGRDEPPEGAFVAAEGAGAIAVRRFDVDLEQDPPTAVFAAPDEPTPGQEEPIDFPYRVSLTDPEVFNLYASARSCDCRWTATLHWVSGGEEGSTVIDDGGEPFRTAASVGAVERYAPRDGRLQPVGAEEPGATAEAEPADAAGEVVACRRAFNGELLQTAELGCGEARRIALGATATAACRPRAGRESRRCTFEDYTCELFSNVDPEAPWSATCAIDPRPGAPGPWLAFYVPPP